MNSLETIAAYWKGELQGEALQQFEERLQSDEAFAAEVADYHRTETIGKYLNGELKEGELKIFEAQLASDEELAAEVEEYQNDSLYQDLTDDLQLLGQQMELEETLKEVGATYKKDLEAAATSLKVEHQQTPSKATKTPSKNKIKSSRLWWIGIAAAAVLAVVFIGIQFFTPPSPEALYAVSIDKQNIANFGTKSSSTEKKLKKGQDAFKQEKYEEVIEILGNMEDSNDEVKVCLGVAYLELNKYSEAIETLESIENEGKKKWYLALAYLKQGNIEKTKEFLLEIDDPHDYYYPKAKKLLSNL